MTRETAQRMRYVFGDLLATSLAWLLFNILRYFIVGNPAGLSLVDYLCRHHVMLMQGLFPLMMSAIYYFSGFYNKPFFKSRVEELLSTLQSTFLGSAAILFLAFIHRTVYGIIGSLEMLVILFTLLFGLVWLERLSITLFAIRRIKSHRWRFPTFIVGSPAAVLKLYRRLTSSPREAARGFDFAGIFLTDEEAEFPQGSPITSIPRFPLDQIGPLAREMGVRNLIVATGQSDSSRMMDLLNRLFPLDLPILISPTLMHLITGKQRLCNVAGEPLVDVSSPSMSQSTVNLKRCGDVVVSGIALLCVAPLLALLAIIIRLDSRGPVIYRQERIGYHKKPFNILKFRTMRVDAEKDGPQLSSANDSRITRAGRIMRKYRLDELPQFWNVFVGDMSLIGPRPEREFFIRRILEKAPYYTLIHQVRPGITSWGMVRHGYASDVEGMIERLQYDIIYIGNVSLLVDIKIMIYTIRTVLTGKGV